MHRSFDQYCDLSRQFDPSPSPSILPDGTVVPPYTGHTVETFIEAFGRLDLLAYSEGYHGLLLFMANHIFCSVNEYWISQGSPNTDFWGHEVGLTPDCTNLCPD